MSQENLTAVMGMKDSVQNLINKASKDPRLGRFKYHVNTHWEGGALCKAKIRNQHKLVVDEQPALGGCDLGVSPVELILVALGTCQEIMYSVVASSMNIELEECDVDLTANMDVRGMLGVESEEKVRPGFSDINYRVKIKSAASDEEIRALVNAVEKQCPVLDMLTREMKVTSSASINNQELNTKEKLI